MANLNKIRDLCRQKNLPLNKLAEQVGISPNGLQRIIKDNSTKIDTLEKIAEILEVPVYFFFDQAPEIKNEQIKELDIDIKTLEKIAKRQADLLTLYRSFLRVMEVRFLNLINTTNDKDLEKSFDKIEIYINFLKVYDPLYVSESRNEEATDREFAFLMGQYGEGKKTK